MAFRSEQEEAIHSLSQILLGSQALFKPKYYASGMKEPADLVWVANRCAVLMYMTSGKQNFDKKRRHNHGQLHRWIRHWKQGEILYGEADGSAHAYAYDDIDFIVGLSIVGGDDVGCLYEPEQVAYARTKDLSSKLAVCSTITDAVFNKLSRRSIGVRDIIHLLVYLKAVAERIDQDSVFEYLDGWAYLLSARMRKEFSGLWTSYDDLEDAWVQTRMSLTAIKLNSKINITDLLADLSLEDAIWLSVAERSLGRQIALPGTVGLLRASALRTSGIYKLHCCVCAHFGEAPSADFFKDMEPADLFLLSSLELGAEIPIRVLMIAEAKVRETILAKALRDLQQIALSPHEAV